MTNISVITLNNKKSMNALQIQLLTKSRTYQILNPKNLSHIS